MAKAKQGKTGDKLTRIKTLLVLIQRNLVELRYECRWSPIGSKDGLEDENMKELKKLIGV